MYLRMAAILVGLLAATTFASAQDSKTRKTSATAPAAKSAARKPKTQVATAPAAAAPREDVSHRGKNATDSRKHGKPDTAAVGAEESPAGPVTFPDSVGWRVIEDPATGARFG